jgi:hypothetical protein
MTNWTKEEMEELLTKMNKLAMTDVEFRKELLADSNAALEKLAGKALPEGFNIKVIERDPDYQTTLVLPDLIDEECLDEEALDKVAGGISGILVLMICAVAVGGGHDAGICGAEATISTKCSAKICGAKVNA